jgi:flavin-dependent dehydrogenase
MQEVDLLIIGSGPAGISTALHMLQVDSSWAERMILIEKVAHPRPKLCGGGVTRIGIETLHNLGINLPLPIPGVEIEKAQFLYQGRSVNVKGNPEFVVYNRIEFDQFIAAEARQRGLLIHENEPVVSIILDSEYARVSSATNDYQAKVVVGADGSKGITRRLFKESRSKYRIARVLETTLPARENDETFTKKTAIFEFTPAAQDLQGYYWEFPSFVAGKSRFNRGVYDARFIPQRDKAKLPAILKEEITHQGGDKQRLDIQGHPIHLFSPFNQFAKPRLILVGDAAGVDPLLGEGIGPAMAYGELAARAINHAFTSGDFSFRGYKKRLLSSALGKYLLKRWLTAGIGYRFSASPVFMHIFWSVGKVVNALWPRGEPLYSMEKHPYDLKSRNGVGDSLG